MLIQAYLSDYVRANPISEDRLKKDYEAIKGNLGTTEYKTKHILVANEDEAKAFIDRLEVFSLLANVADVKSLVIHPASTTHSQLTDAELAEQQIYQNTIRLSIGTEHIDDIIADLEAGFAAVRGE